MIDNFFIDFDMFLFVANVKFERFNEMIVLKNVSNSKIWFRDVAKVINETNCEVSEQIIADFSTNLYENSSAEIRRLELLTDFRAWCWRICSWNLLLKLNIWLQRQHVVDFFVDSDLISSVKNERFERFNRMIVLKITNDVSSNSHTKLIALIERWEFLTSFKTSCLRICSYNFLLKLKFCLQSLQITRTHVTSWFDALFNDFDTILSVAIERFKHIDETDELIAFSTSTCFRASCSINSTCFWTSCSRWCARRASN